MLPLIEELIHRRFVSGMGWLLSLVFLLLIVGSMVTYAQTGGGYDLTWWTVDGGGSGSGAKQVSGGSYELLSTVGQPEAKAAISGGVYTLESGFWHDNVQTANPTTNTFLLTILK